MKYTRTFVSLHNSFYAVALLLFPSFIFPPLKSTNKCEKIVQRTHAPGYPYILVTKNQKKDSKDFT